MCIAVLVMIKYGFCIFARWKEVPDQGLCWSRWFCSSVQSMHWQQSWWNCCSQGKVDPFQIHYGTICHVPSHHHIYMLSSQVQKPPFPWEFHMYRQLDCRIPENQVCTQLFPINFYLITGLFLLLSHYYARDQVLDWLRECTSIQTAVYLCAIIYHMGHSR